MAYQCSNCGRTDPRAGATHGCYRCAQHLGLAPEKCGECGAMRWTVDDTGRCRVCRRAAEQP